MTAESVLGMGFPPLTVDPIDGLGVYPGGPDVRDRSDRGRFTGTRIETTTYVCEQAGTFEIPGVIIDIINTIAPDEETDDIKPDVRLRDQLDLDSMDFLDIVMELRKRYGVQVPEEDYKELATLEGCANYLEPHMADKELKVGV